MQAECKIRTRYGETDQMGVVYYGNYALYLEEARTDLLRQAGANYKALEESGVMLPVVSLNVKYLRSVAYDELITLRTVIQSAPSRTVTFYTEMFNEKMEKLNECEVTLIFMNKETRKVMRCPEALQHLLNPYLQDDET